MITVRRKKKNDFFLKNHPVCYHSKQQNWLYSGTETLALGGIVALIAYLVGWIISTILGEEGGLH